eukprot:bmy_10819T0
MEFAKQLATINEQPFQNGPIHHFIKLVSCGLSKNPYQSVTPKWNTEWFKNYFNEKQVILKESYVQLSCRP